MRKFRSKMQQLSQIPAKYASVQAVLDADLKFTPQVYQIQIIFFTHFVNQVWMNIFMPPLYQKDSNFSYYSFYLFYINKFPSQNCIQCTTYTYTVFSATHCTFHLLTEYWYNVHFSSISASVLPTVKFICILIRCTVCYIPCFHNPYCTVLKYTNELYSMCHECRVCRIWYIWSVCRWTLQ